ncbi:MAG: metal-dependent transcriptional regulator, partial [Deltaproteobacteria bacterium]|nr:metal-dependent transcriptional regulator [Deltaproteobacteria bacterium]MBW2532633.1 metal-dependent transcriptional regulator [Deltaproteobacteria bacterium]
MGGHSHKGELTGSLEDYLETIYLLIQERRVARVRDIAKARDVKAGSVTPALRRLADLGLIEYEQREYIDLTERGEQEARRVLARHQLLTRFFHEVLQMPADSADAEACKLEHSLSDEAMDRLVRFFEFLAVCPHRPPALLEAFHACNLVQGTGAECPVDCQLLQTNPAEGSSATKTGEGAGAGKRRRSEPRRRASTTPSQPDQPSRRTALDLAPGETGKIVHIHARGDRRRVLLDKGILPDVDIQMVRPASSGGGVRVLVRGAELSL